MARIPLPLGPMSDSAKSRQGGGAMLTNCYVEATQGGKTNYTINARPRLKLFSIVAAGNKLRGGIAVGNSFYVVAGETVYKVTSGGVATSLGTVIGQNTVTMSANTKKPNPQITITSDTLNYYLENDVLTQITDPDLPSGCHSNCYLNGRTIYGLNSGEYFFSDANATQNINALSFAEAERDSDDGVRVITVGEDFWYFGTRSLEIMRYTGDTFPFGPLLGAGQGKGSGCGAKSSVVLINSAVVWVNDFAQVVMSSGGLPQKISTNKIDRDLEADIKAGLSDQLLAFDFVTEGHQFYIIRSPNWCWAYDFATGFWYRFKDYLSNTFRVGFLVKAFNKNLVLNATDGKIYEFTFDVAKDDADDCIMEILTSPMNAFPDGYICDALNLDLQSGVGLVSGGPQTQDPMVMLNVSRDGGMTFGGEDRRSAGVQGQWGAQIKYNRLGSTNGAGMVFKFAFSAPVEKAVFQASIDARKLRG